MSDHRLSIQRGLNAGRSVYDLALDLGLSDWEVVSLGRELGLIDDGLTKADLLFLASWSKKLPRPVIADALKLPSQNIWRYQNKHRLSAVSADSISQQVAVSTFQFLIESKLKLPLDKNLPKRLSRECFSGPYYSIYSYALDEVKASRSWFSALGMLAQISYPLLYRHFQFKAGNAAEFATKDQLNEALQWSFEKMTGIDLLDHHYDEAEILMLLTEPEVGFTADELRSFYVARNHWRRWYHSFQDLKQGLARSIGILKTGDGRRRANTQTLRRVLQEHGRQADVCEVCTEGRAPEIHHIFPVADTEDFLSSQEVNASENLIVLCPLHHRLAAGFDWYRCYLDGNQSERRELLRQFLIEIPS